MSGCCRRLHSRRRRRRWLRKALFEATRRRATEKLIVAFTSCIMQTKQIGSILLEIKASLLYVVDITSTVVLRRWLAPKGCNLLLDFQSCHSLYLRHVGEEYASCMMKTTKSNSLCSENVPFLFVVSTMHGMESAWVCFITPSNRLRSLCVWPCPLHAMATADHFKAPLPLVSCWMMSPLVSNKVISVKFYVHIRTTRRRSKTRIFYLKAAPSEC